MARGESSVNTDQSELAPGQSQQSGKRVAGIRLRVLALILLPQAAMIWWVADSEVGRGVYIICYSLMMPTVLYLMIVRVLRKWLPFEDNELLLGYIVLTATIPIIGFGGMRFLIPGAGFIPYFSNIQPQLARYIPYLAHLPLLNQPDAINDLYRGGAAVPWQAWIVPITFWSIYLLLLSTIWIGLAAILRRIWIHQERLPFPIAVLPMQLMDQRDDIFKRPLLWLGFAIPAILQSLLVLHEWAPAVPCFQLKAFDIKPLIFPDLPWSAIPNISVSFQPLAVGLAYFVPSDLSFSCWFFWLVGKLSYAIGASMGIDAGGSGISRFPYRDEQGAGSWVALAVIIMWSARKHWLTVVKSIPAEERRTVVLLALGSLVCMALCAAMMSITGIHPAVAAVVITVYVAFVLTGARVRAEAGGQWTFAPINFTPHRVAASMFGTQISGERGLVAGGYFDLLHVDIRAQSLPYMMEGLKTAEVAGIKWRTVLTWIAVGTVTALAMGWCATLTEYYSLGAATAKTDQYVMRKVQIAMNNLDQLVNNPMASDSVGILAMSFAAALTWFLAFIRAKILAFPFHPVGYVLSNTLTMNAFFVPFFLAWLIKVLILRFGGATIYRRSMPFFVGMVLGDVITQGTWTLIGWAFNVPIYQFLT